MLTQAKKLTPAEKKLLHRFKSPLTKIPDTNRSDFSALSSLRSRYGSNTLFLRGNGVGEQKRKNNNGNIEMKGE